MASFADDLRAFVEVIAARCLRCMQRLLLGMTCSPTHWLDATSHANVNVISAHYGFCRTDPDRLQP